MDIMRKYSHAEHGDIGEVALTVPADGWTLNGQALSEAAVQHLATFALQTFQDAYAGAKNAGDAKGNFDKKLAKVMDGTIGTRLGGPRDPVKARAIIIAMGHAKVTKAGDVFTAALGKTTATGDSADKAKRGAAIKAIAVNPAYMHLAERQIAEEKELGVYDDAEGDDAE